VRAGDYDRPETLDPALAGVEKLLLVSGSEVGRRVAQHTNVVEAAQRAGVQRILYTSVLRARTTELVIAPEHRATEEVIRSSGLPYTMLRNVTAGTPRTTRTSSRATSPSGPSCTRPVRVGWPLPPAPTSPRRPRSP